MRRSLHVGGVNATRNAREKTKRKNSRSRFNPECSGCIVTFFLLCLNTHAAPPTRNMAIVESMKGAPSMAPTPTSSLTFAELPANIATRGTIVSGRAVPTAANMLPVTPSENFSLLPRDSMALVNISAAITMTMREIMSIIRSWVIKV